MHVLAVGTTYCGKSTLLRHICKQHRKHGRGSIVWEPRFDEKWRSEVKAQLCTRSGDHFLKVAKETQNKCLVVEDAADQIGRYSREFGWLATDARHNGHTSMFGTQTFTGLDPKIRSNCAYIYAFTCGMGNAKLMAEEYICDAFLECPNLPLGTYIYFNRMTRKSEKGKLF